MFRATLEHVIATVAVQHQRYGCHQLMLLLLLLLLLPSEPLRHIFARLQEQLKIRLGNKSLGRVPFIRSRVTKASFIVTSFNGTIGNVRGCYFVSSLCYDPAN